MVPSKLTPLQEEILEAFFRHESRFFLTGGAALAGYHLGHRETHDLDLFVTSDLLEDGERALGQAAGDIGATVENIRTSRDFRRRLVKRDEASVVVDLVHDTAPQGKDEKLEFGNVRVDHPLDIMANKLCSLLSRSEPRDLVDVMALEEAGVRVEDAIPLGKRKDTGLTPAQLAWIVSQITIGDDADLPGGASAPALRGFLEDLQRRLSREAFPN